MKYLKCCLKKDKIKFRKVIGVLTFVTYLTSFCPMLCQNDTLPPSNLPIWRDICSLSNPSDTLIQALAISLSVWITTMLHLQVNTSNFSYAILHVFSCCLHRVESFTHLKSGQFNSIFLAERIHSNPLCSLRSGKEQHGQLQQATACRFSMCPSC